MKLIFDYKKTNDSFDFKKTSKSKLEIVSKKGITFAGKKFVSIDTGLIAKLSSMSDDKELVNLNVRPIANLSTLGVICFETFLNSDYRGKILLNFFNFDDRAMFIPDNTSIAEVVVSNLFEIEIDSKEQSLLTIEGVLDKISEKNIELQSIEQITTDTVIVNEPIIKKDTDDKGEEPVNLKTILKNIFKKKEGRITVEKMDEINAYCEKAASLAQVADEPAQNKYRVDVNDGTSLTPEYLNAKNERAAYIGYGRLKKKYPGCDLKLFEFDEKVKLYKEIPVKEKKDKTSVDESELKTFIIEKRDNDTNELIDEIEVKGKDGRSANATLMGLRKKEPGFRYQILKEDER